MVGHEWIDYTKFANVHPVKKPKRRSGLDIKRIIIHCTDRNWSLNELVNYDINPNHISNTGLATCTYHHVIMPDGTDYKVVPYKYQTAHAGGYNRSSIAIAIMYKVKDQNENLVNPPSEAIESAIMQTARLCRMFNVDVSKVQGHRELKGTGWFLNSQGSKRLRKSCPGLKIDLNNFREEVSSSLWELF